MCGICGAVTPAAVKNGEYAAVVGQMASRIAHRGPDGHGSATNRLGVFAHVRLAIVDVAGGRQPIFNEDGSAGIVFNGEIYNYQELRAGLVARGHTFKTKTDTEVVLHLFEEYGTQAFGKLIGMFAFALWTADRVYIARDQVGIKPLYYGWRGESLFFCSELKGMMVVPGMDFSICPAGVRRYLTFRYFPSAETVFNGVKKLPAAHYLEVANGEATVKRYYDLSEHVRITSPGERVEAIHETMREVVGSQLMGEVPIGLTLSGGVDSSAIAHYINRLGASLETFNIGFPGVNEFRYSEGVARRFFLSHTMVMMNPSELAGYLPKYVNAIDEPLADAACLPLYKLCETIRDKVTVVLSGEGGDEIFGGYPQYASTLASFNKSSDGAFQSFLRASWYFMDNDDLFGGAALNPSEIPARERFKGSPLTAMTAYDMHTWIPENLMMKADKILMAHSLEGRFPFLDLRMMELAAGIPDNEKIGKDGTTKRVLKNAMRGILPVEVIDRPKMGFTVPIGELLKTVESTVQDAMRSVTALETVISRDALISRLEGHFDGSRPDPLRIWTIFILYHWITQNQSVFGGIRKSEPIMFGKKTKPATQTPPAPAEPRFDTSKPYLRGVGMEIGAGAFPQRLPEGVKCEYFDKRDAAGLAALFAVDEKAFPYKVRTFQQFASVFPSGADFLIAHNVLEHSADPIGTLAGWMNYLKDGGVMALSVPDAERCPDAGRLLPSTEHLLMDYLIERDESCYDSREHIYSFLMGWCDSGRSEKYAKTQFARDAHNATREPTADLHWHAYNETLFKSVIGYAALFAGKRVEPLASALPSGSSGDIIAVFRVSPGTGASGDEYLAGVRGKLAKALSKLDSAFGPARPEA